MCSDQLLCDWINHDEAAALGVVYDRYAPLVFTLLSQAQPYAAASLLEEVFIALWRRGRTAPVNALLPLLLQLTADAVASNQLREGHAADTQAPLLPLAPFQDLPPHIFTVMVLACLGKLPISELSIALACDQRVVQQALATGLALVRVANAP